MQLPENSEANQTVPRNRQLSMDQKIMERSLQTALAQNQEIIDELQSDGKSAGLSPPEPPKQSNLKAKTALDSIMERKEETELREAEEPALDAAAQSTAGLNTEPDKTRESQEARSPDRAAELLDEINRQSKLLEISQLNA